MKVSKIFIDICGACAILGIVMWNVIAIWNLITGATLYWAAIVGITAFAIAAVCLVTAGIILIVKLVKERKNKNKEEKQDEKIG